MTTEVSDDGHDWIVDSIKDVIWSGSADMSHIERVNPAFEALTGRVAEDLYRSSDVLFDVVHPDDRDRVRRVVEENSDRDWIVRCRVVHTNGSIHWVEAHGFAPIDGRRAGICRDIADSLERNERLEASLRLSTEMGRTAKIGGWELNAETSLVSWNDQVFEIFEMPPAAAPPLDGAINLYHPDDQAIIEAAVQRGLEKGDPYDLELRIQTAKGNLKYVYTQGRPVVVDGRTVKLWGTIQDITDRKLIDMERSASEVRRRTVLETAPDSVVLLDQAGIVEEWNRAAEIMFGYSAEEAIGSRLADLIIPEQHRKAHADGLAEFARSGEGPLFGSIVEVDALRADGSTLPVEIAVHGSEVSGQRFSVGIVRDRSERVESEQRMLMVFEQLVGAMARTVGNRDPYTAAHQTRVRDLSVAIAVQLGLGSDEIRGITYGAMIHDIGKLAVPAEILNRPGKLTSLEFEMIKSHSEVGAEIISEVVFPWPVRSVVLQHHERLDGSGYPYGLKAAEISNEAKIVAVADVVEAMSSDRPYRPALGIDAALAEISKGRGVKFDTDAVDACVGLLRGHQFEFSSEQAG